VHRLIAQNRRAISIICERYGVSKLEVFGSAARGGDFDEDWSDADFLVEFLGNRLLGPLEEYFGLREALSELLGRPVDLIEPGAIRNPYVLGGVNQSRETVYAA
jgi:uncharacterized protein